MPWRTLDYDDFLTSLHLINHCILFVQFGVVGVEFSEAGILQLEQEKAPVPNLEDKNTEELQDMKQ